MVFAETALRQVIEVIDRRRPVAQLRPVMTPVLVDRVIAHARVTHRRSATIRRVRVRSVDPAVDPGVGPAVEAGVQKSDKHGEVYAAEVFASFSRSGRVHAVAARIERYRNRWRMVALQIGLAAPYLGSPSFARARRLARRAASRRSRRVPPPLASEG